MIDHITLSGVVLMAAPVGEYDKRMVILTRQRGKITVFARGARKPTSKFSAGTRPFSFGEFTLYQGKEAYNLVDISISSYFDEISQNIDTVYYGFYFLEMADYFSYENVEAKEMIILIYKALKALLNESIPNKLVRYIFELRSFAINGEYPQVFSCCDCGCEENLSGFEINKGGAVCGKCMGKYKDAIELNTSTFYTMQYVISAPVEKLYTFNVSEQVLRELSMILGRWRKRYIDKEFKSLPMIE